MNWPRVSIHLAVPVTLVLVERLVYLVHDVAISVNDAFGVPVSVSVHGPVHTTPGACVSVEFLTEAPSDDGLAASPHA